jgi:hypothetical protein
MEADVVGSPEANFTPALLDFNCLLALKGPDESGFSAVPLLGRIAFAFWQTMGAIIPYFGQK